MIGRIVKSVALAATAVLAANALASAQDAILLESIGAVRMATPEELQRAAPGQGRSVVTDQQRLVPPARRVGAVN